MTGKPFSMFAATCGFGTATFYASARIDSSYRHFDQSVGLSFSPGGFVFGFRVLVRFVLVTVGAAGMSVAGGFWCFP